MIEPHYPLPSPSRSQLLLLFGIFKHQQTQPRVGLAHVKAATSYLCDSEKRTNVVSYAEKFGLAVALLCKDAGWVWEGQTCYWSFFHQTSFKQGFNQYTAIAMIEPVDYGFQHFEIKQVVISLVRMIFKELSAVCTF